METLSQASEELRVREGINQSDSNGRDECETYEVSEGSEASVEVRQCGIILMEFHLEHD